MLKEFIDFVHDILPSVSPELSSSAKLAIEQFNNDGLDYDFLMKTKLPYLSQGDIISDIPFIWFDNEGQQQIFKAKGMIISTSCHIDQKDNLIIVPIYPISSFSGNIGDLKSNKIFDYMYIKDFAMQEYFIDFSTVNTYSKEMIVKGLSTENIERILSLSQIGYYFFIVKLTVYFMREEDSQTLETRLEGQAIDNHDTL